ncbi:MAG TPA: ShlB/FhaC/HecB family hemolysin secretion/activation protein [Verrucomicrobiales bacterium]|nr:ShlB/FhaC/HecB family hemolysin secretion/activation protein [Verrucomicrobiales bacterium]
MCCPILHPAFFGRGPAIVLSAVLLLGAAAFSTAQNVDLAGPRSLPGSDEGSDVAIDESFDDADADDVPLIPVLHGVVLWSDPGLVVFDGITGVSGLEIRGVALPDPDDLRRELAPYFGSPFSFASLQDLTRAIVGHYRKSDRPLVDVIVPEHDLTHGVLQLVVLEGRLGETRVRGNRWFSDAILLDPLRIEPGDVVRQSKLLDDLDWLNRNPFRRVDLVYTPGTEPGQTDLILDTSERFPLRIYTGIENSGTESVGEEILFAGLNWGNAFQADHILSYQFTFTPDLEGLLSHSAVYEIPLPWRHRLRILGLHVETESDELPDSSFDSQGTSSQVSTRYETPIPRWGGLTHSLFWGFDFKSTNNNLEFGGSGVFDTTTEIFQFSTIYQGLLRDRWGSTGLEATLVLSPGDWSSHNRDDVFDEVRPGAEGEYAYARMDLEREFTLPAGFSVNLRLTGQAASVNLLASEQLGAGGYRTVRGYEEYEVRGDEGLLASIELRSPPFSLTEKLAPAWFRDRMQLLAFWDHGWVTNRDRLAGEPSSVDLCSTGVGLRYEVQPWCALRLDYGIQLEDSGFGNGDNSRLHFGLQIGN